MKSAVINNKYKGYDVTFVIKQSGWKDEESLFFKTHRGFRKKTYLQQNLNTDF